MISPKISHIEWGQIIANNHKYKDVMCFPGGCIEWDWTKNNTNHRQGINVNDVKELLKYGSEIIILSKGFRNRIRNNNQTISFLEQKDIEYYILETSEAVDLYNQLCENKNVGALIHSTC